MKKTILILTTLFMASAANAADCYEALTANYTKDSQNFQLSEDEVGNYDDIEIEYATSAVDGLMKKLDCAVPVIVDHTASECAEIVPGNSSSLACYVSTDLGYFIVTTDYLENTNLLFNRWD